MDMTLAMARWAQWAWSLLNYSRGDCGIRALFKICQKLSLFSENFGTIGHTVTTPRSTFTPSTVDFLLTCHFCYFVISAMTSSRGITHLSGLQHLTCFFLLISSELCPSCIMLQGEYMLKLTLKSKWFVLWPWSHPSTELHISSRKGPTGSCGQRNKR